jgi:glycerol-3-phosphate acyltransferase PlsY
MSLYLIYGFVVMIIAYFVGSIPIGLLFARARNVDLYTIGSGNIGATNVARALGKKVGAVVLVLDVLKGALPLVLVFALDLDVRVDPFVITGTGFAAICGHCFPVWLFFRGGKGVATSLGVFVVLDPLIAGITVAVFILVCVMFRIVSIASMAAAVLIPTLLWILGRSDAAVTLGLAVAVLVIVRHRANISRLLRGEENRL